MESQALSAPKGVEEVIHSASESKSKNSTLFNQIVSKLTAIVRKRGKNDQHASHLFTTGMWYVNQMLVSTSLRIVDDQTKQLFYNLEAVAEPVAYDHSEEKYIILPLDDILEGVLLECGLDYQIGSEEELRSFMYSLRDQFNKALSYILENDSTHELRTLNNLIAPLTDILLAMGGSFD